MEITKIYKLDSDARGVAKIEGRSILVDKVLPNEEISVIEKNKFEKFDTAKEIKIVKTSEDRVLPLCPYYNFCGGCSLQHASNYFQKNFKIDKVKNSLKHIANLEVKIDDYIEGKKKFGYRNKIVFAVQNGKCGMYKPFSKEFVEINNCLLVSDNLNYIYHLVRDWISADNVLINHLAIREIGEKYCIVLIGEEKPKIKNLIEILDKNYKGKYQIVFNKNNAYKDLITDNLENLYGEEIIDKRKGIEYPVSANSFLQVNDEVSELLYNEVQQNVDGDTVINAYSGAGFLSAILSKNSKHVYGVEIVKNAHINAQKLKDNNAIKNLTNICGKSEVEIPKILSKIKQATVVLDPPRKGVDKSLLKLLNKNSKITKLIYVSCSPNSLAKDIRELSNFKIKSIKLFDMFPMSHHIETLVCMEK